MVIIGAKGSGKTTLAAAVIRAAGRGAVYVDPARTATIGHSLTGREDAARVVEALRAGHVLRWPCWAAQVGSVVSAAARLCIAARADLWVDEAHLAMPSPDLDELITSGRHLGVSTGLLTQAPQGLRTRALHAGALVAAFRLPMGQPWLRSYGLPTEPWADLAVAPPHSYLLIWPDGQVSGPRRLKR